MNMNVPFPELLKYFLVRLLLALFTGQENCKEEPQIMNTAPSREDILGLASRWESSRRISPSYRIHTDTTNFIEVKYGDVIVLDNAAYYIRQNAKEGRFGLDDEEKFWVKNAIDLASGERKIIKLVFHESFIAHIGGIEFECFRSPRKESRILNMVGEHENFMHGRSFPDEKGNIVRLIDYIYGKSLADTVEDISVDHETYFYHHFQQFLQLFMESIYAIKFLHDNDEKHGDIRRDHIIIDRDSGHYRWIDFDFNYKQRENIYSYDLFGLGNIFMFLVGKGDVLVPDLKKASHPSLFSLGDDDVNIVFNNRVANLKKIYPYIPETLNRVLMHFSKGTKWYYENTSQMLEDLESFRAGSLH